jgi:small nuclear ribonucleoprotein (snRNP)-like protein
MLSVKKLLNHTFTFNCFAGLNSSTMATSLCSDFAAEIRNRTVRVQLKNGLSVCGRVVETDEHMNIVLDSLEHAVLLPGPGAPPFANPPHIAPPVAKELFLRGSAIDFIDVDARKITSVRVA